MLIVYILNRLSVMRIAVLNYETGKVDILENVPEAGDLKTYFIEHSVEHTLRKLTREDGLLDVIETYLSVVCNYHLSEIDYMVMDGVNYIDMK